jgi:hypothetical protein
MGGLQIETVAMKKKKKNRNTYWSPRWKPTIKELNMHQNNSEIAMGV